MFLDEEEVGESKKSFQTVIHFKVPPKDWETIINRKKHTTWVFYYLVLKSLKILPKAIKMDLKNIPVKKQKLREMKYPRSHSQ